MDDVSKRIRTLSKLSDNKLMCNSCHVNEHPRLKGIEQ
jgi:hypothetical protein